MAAINDVDELIEQFRLAEGQLVKGNPEAVKKLFSHREDVTLANPYGPPVRGWEQVAQTVEHSASLFRDGEMVAIEVIAKHVTLELAYVVEIERGRAKVGGSEDITPFALRETMIFRPEDGVLGHFFILWSVYSIIDPCDAYFGYETLYPPTSA